MASASAAPIAVKSICDRTRQRPTCMIILSTASRIVTGSADRGISVGSGGGEGRGSAPGFSLAATTSLVIGASSGSGGESGRYEPSSDVRGRTISSNVRALSSTRNTHVPVQCQRSASSGRSVYGLPTRFVLRLTSPGSDLAGDAVNVRPAESSDSDPVPRFSTSKVLSYRNRVNCASSRRRPEAARSHSRRIVSSWGSIARRPHRDTLGLCAFGLIRELGLVIGQKQRRTQRES